MRTMWLGIILTLVSSSLVGGCRSDTGPTTGSESHFLRQCQATCAAGFECLCGVCSRQCAEDGDCRDLHSRAECIAVADRPAEWTCPDEAVNAFCDVRCSTAADCSGLGSGFLCRSGFCREDPNGELAADGRIDVDELCDFYVSDVCDAKIECYGWEYRDREHCLAAQECDGLPDFHALLADGLVTFDPVATYECHEALLADPCSLGLLLTVPPLPSALRACGALTGLVEEGGACTGIECGEGLTCRLSDGCPGVCERSDDLAEGEACVIRLCLQETDHCGPCAPGLVCHDSVCRPEWTLGEPCTALADCGEYWCNQELGQCAPRASSGEACSDFRDIAPPCASGLWCSGGTTEAGVCLSLSDEGGPCEADGDCLEPFSCLPSTSPDILAPGTCGSSQPNGASCDSYADCESYLCTSDYVCSPQPALGETCTGECAEGLSCGPDSICVEKRYPGDSCDAASECMQSRCENGVCVIRHHLGEACAVNDDCLSGYCVSGICTDPVGCTDQL